MPEPNRIRRSKTVVEKTHQSKTKEEELKVEINEANNLIEEEGEKGIEGSLNNEEGELVSEENISVNVENNVNEEIARQLDTNIPLRTMSYSPKNSKMLTKQQKESMILETRTEVVYALYDSCKKWRPIANSEADAGVTFSHFRNAIGDYVTYVENHIRKNEEMNYDILFDYMTVLSETARAYYDDHRGHRFFKKGKTRKAMAEDCIKLVKDCFIKLDIAEGGPGLVDTEKNRHASDKFTLDDVVEIETKMEKLDSYYARWCKFYAGQENEEVSRIYKKFAILSKFEDEIAIYKRRLKKEYWGAYKVVADYDFYKLQIRMLERNKKTSKEKDLGFFDEDIKQHVLEMDEKEETKLSEKEVDDGLTEEQLRAVEEIDKWFIRNANNGGIFGTIIPILKNAHSDIVDQLFTKTKRERLFIYYLIETKERKKPNIVSVYNSQYYVPSLTKFKKQMNTTKIKFLSRMTGGYVHMEKLSEALEINREFKDVVKECSLIQRDNLKEEEEKNQVAEVVGINDENGVEVEDNKELEEDAREIADITGQALSNRRKKLKSAFDVLIELQKMELQYNKAEKSKKAGLEKKINELKQNSEVALNELVEADKAVGNTMNKYGILAGDYHAEFYNNDRQNRNELSDLAGYAAKGAAKGAIYTSTVVSGFKSAANFTGKYVLRLREPMVSWKLEGSALANTKLVGLKIGTSVGVLGNILATMNVLYDLGKNGHRMSKTDIGLSVITALGYVGEAVSSIASFVDYAPQYANMAQGTVEFAAESAEAVAGTTTKVIGGVASGVGVVLGVANQLSAGLNSCRADHAKEYLNNKHLSQYRLSKKDESELSEEELAKKKQLDKEVRYEKSMLILSEKLSNRQGIAGAFTVGSSLLFMSAQVLGPLATVAGFGVMILGKIVDSKMMSKARTALFDAYFEFNKFAEKMLKKAEKKKVHIYDVDKFKERLRMRLAAAAGFADMTSANNFIAAKFADMIRYKLFASNIDKNSDEIKGYIYLVKSFNLKYDPEKNQPDRDMIIRKLTGR